MNNDERIINRIRMASPYDNFVKIQFIWTVFLVSALLTTVGSIYVSRPSLMNASAFPQYIDAVVGEEIFMKNTEAVPKQTVCYYRMTGGNDIDIKTPHKQNIASWSNETCGLRINNVTMEDGGFWRLTSMNTNNNDVTRGIIYVTVQSEIPKPPKIQEIDSFDADITPAQAKYCYVLRPDQPKTVFPEHEFCTFPTFNSDSEGNGIWHVVSGIKGKTEELTFQVNVKTKVEQLLTFVEHNSTTSTLNMKCKLINTKKITKFCRFLRLNDDIGFNLEDGRGEERYYYYGNGFKNNECGISILNPDESDKTPWKCFIGVEFDEEVTTVGALIDGTDPQKDKTPGDIETTDVYGLEDTPVNILCKRSIQTDYCWFRDPSGKKISLSDKKAASEDDMYRYYGTGIELGECGLTILKATHDHSGTWSCHMGTTRVAGTDTVQEISVRITETPLVSTNLFQDAREGTSLQLECRSIPEHVPLDYCRFVLPDGTGFSINENTTIHNALMNNYYFNPNRKLNTGYCSIIVKKIERAQHQGQWMCAARNRGNDLESSDEFRVSVFEADNSVAAAGITGMIFILVFLAGGFIFLTYRKYRQTYPPSRRTTRQTLVTYVTGADSVSFSSERSDGSQIAQMPEVVGDEAIELQTRRQN